MNYGTVIPAEFISRPNRFIANVMIYGKPEIVHVKNTGRCKELLIPGAEVYLEKTAQPNRKTAYGLIAVRKNNGLLINIDSQAPNKVVREWLDSCDYDTVQPEFTYGNSTIDFLWRRGNNVA